jgi:hypothetical protein
MVLEVVVEAGQVGRILHNTLVLCLHGEHMGSGTWLQPDIFICIAEGVVETVMCRE